MKKKIAPIIIVIIVGMFITIWAGTGFWSSISFMGFPLMGIFFGLIGIGAIGALIAVLISRMKEIDEEDEDDLKKY